ncbi:MAG: VTT domain-containing protein [Gemmatimonadaceae bacterium]
MPSGTPFFEPEAIAAPTRLQRVFFKLEQWANAGWANSVVFGWGLLQATCIPGFVDLFFLPLALAKPKSAYRLGLASAAGLIIGSTALYWIGASALSQLSGPVASWLGVGAHELQSMHTLLDRYGWLAIFASTMSPLSTKLTSVASGAFNVPWWSFLDALTTGRLLRVGVLAYLVQHGGAASVARWLKVPPQTHLSPDVVVK